LFLFLKETVAVGAGAKPLPLVAQRLVFRKMYLAPTAAHHVAAVLLLVLAFLRKPVALPLPVHAKQF